MPFCCIYKPHLMDIFLQLPVGKIGHVKVPGIQLSLRNQGQKGKKKKTQQPYLETVSECPHF